MARSRTNSFYTRLDSLLVLTPPVCLCCPILQQLTHAWTKSGLWSGGENTWDKCLCELRLCCCSCDQRSCGIAWCGALAWRHHDNLVDNITVLPKTEHKEEPLTFLMSDKRLMIFLQLRYHSVGPGLATITLAAQWKNPRFSIHEPPRLFMRARYPPKSWVGGPRVPVESPAVQATLISPPIDAMRTNNRYWNWTDAAADMAWNIVHFIASSITGITIFPVIPTTYTITDTARHFYCAGRVAMTTRSHFSTVQSDEFSAR